MFGLFKSKAKEPSVSKSTTISESSVSASLPPKPSETNYEAEAASNRIAA